MSTSPTPSERIDALRTVIDAALLVVENAGAHGIAAGPLYALLMPSGLTLDRFNWVMGILVQAERVRKCGHHYHATTPTVVQAAQTT